MFHWYWLFAFFFLLIHLKSIVITIYFHRSIAHGLLELSKPLDEFFKFFTWTFDMYSDNYKKEYRAGHIKHHRYSDSVDDPHSPHFFSLKQMMFVNPKLPGDAYFLTDEEIEKYTKNIQINSTWLDKKIYSPYKDKGVWVWHIIITLLFGPIGLLLSLLLLRFMLNALIQFFNPYLLHKIGYKSSGGKTNTEDKSRNFIPFGILLAGEELHSNHHNFMGQVNFAKKWYEFDIGYAYIKILKHFKLLNITKDRFNKPNSLTR